MAHMTDTPKPLGAQLLRQPSPIDFKFSFRLSDKAKAKIKAIEDNQRRASSAVRDFLLD